MVNPFRRSARKHPQLRAHWDSRQELWTFRELPVDEHGKLMPGFNPMPADPKAERLFKDAVRIVFGLLRSSPDPDIRALTSTLREPCQVWLDLMRKEKRGFKRVEQVRASHFRYLRAWLEDEAELPPHAVRLLEDGYIQLIFKESADFWDDLADRGFELEATTTPTENGGEIRADAGAGTPDPEQAERARVRKAVVMPILTKKNWTRSKWATKAGVGKNSAYEYLDGRRSLSDANRKAMAEALELKLEQLPN